MSILNGNDKPTITITLDPIKGPQLNTNIPLETAYLILTGSANNMLVQLLAAKVSKTILTPETMLASV